MGNFFKKVTGALPGVGEVFGDTPSAKPSGAFPKEQLEALGTGFGDFLLDRLNTPVTETETFDLGSQAIRDALSTQGATARQRLGDAANTGGFLDSGAVTGGLIDIERGQAQAFAQQMQQLILALEDRREQGILPFLSQGSAESTQIGIANAGFESASQLQSRQQGHEVGMSFLGGGGGSSGGGGGFF